MSKNTDKRNPYADTGLMVAVSILIVAVINTLLFDATWESILCIIASVAYCAVSYRYDSGSKTVRSATTAFLTLTAAILIVMIFVDRKAQPKMHAFEGAKTDTIAEEVFVQNKEPELITIIEEDTTEVADTTLVEEDIEQEAEPETTDSLPSQPVTN